MKQRRYLLIGALFVILASSAAVFLVFKLYYYQVPEMKKSPSFVQWQRSQAFSNIELSDTAEYSKVVASPYLHIDRIYRSMEGPMGALEFFVDDNLLHRIQSLFKPQLIWITGYKVELYDEQNLRVSDDYMCHNNLNIGSRNVLPWKLKTLGTDKRLFTLSEGQTETRFPANTGIPILANQRLRMDYQVLNHNLPKIDLKVKHVVTVYYRYASAQQMTALYQQTIFATKQIAGPRGGFNEVPAADVTEIKNLNRDEVKNCCTPGGESVSGFPFRDAYQREFTGHWTIDEGEEEVRTTINPMLNLSQGTKIHFISVHVHPFCESLTLTDQTSVKEVYQARAVNFPNKIGLASISKFSSAEGIPLNTQHSYELRSIYRKTSKERHTAMATMSLYCEEN